MPDRPSAEEAGDEVPATDDGAAAIAGPEAAAGPGVGEVALRLSTRTVIVLVGPSSSGKSTWAASRFRSEQIVSSDDLRAVVGESRHDQRASGDAFDLLDRIVAARLGRRLTTVIDTLGLDEGRRRGWIAAAHDAGMQVVAVRLDVPAKVVRSRNAARDRSLPAAALSRQIRTHEVTTADLLASEGFDRVLDLAPEDVRDVHLLPPGFPDARPAGTTDLRPAGTTDLRPAGTTDLRPAGATDLRPAAATDVVRAPDVARQPTMRFGLQVSRFDPPAGQLAQHLADVAVAAEQAGFSQLWVMDHVIQIPQVGREWEDMLEAYTTLGYLAGVTRTIQLGTLVTGITYRKLTHLAKIIATLDVLSEGRARCGLGAAWFEREHKAYGWDFPPLGERYDLLRDACELLPLMWGPGTPAFEGRTMTVPEALCYPRPIQERIPILIGGSGERSTLRLVAEHADACNLFGDPAIVGRRVEVLRRHCADVGRDPGEVEVTNLTSIMVAPDRATLDQRLAAMAPPDRAPESVAERLNAGTVDDHVDRCRAYAAAGVDTCIVSLADLDADRVRELAPLIAAFA